MQCTVQVNAKNGLRVALKRGCLVLENFCELHATAGKITALTHPQHNLRPNLNSFPLIPITLYSSGEPKPYRALHLQLLSSPSTFLPPLSLSHCHTVFWATDWTAVSIRITSRGWYRTGTLYQVSYPASLIVSFFL